MSETGWLRVIDENTDRLAEGLRVLEDLARMVLDDAGLSSRLKDLRHNLIRGDLAFNLALLGSRDASADVGQKLEVSGEPRERSLPLIAVANARRAQEALRVLEEMAALPAAQRLSAAASPNSHFFAASRLDSARFKTARFSLYTIEKELVGRLARQEQARLIRGLYVIVDLTFLRERDPISITRQLLQCGVKVIQLRAKNPEKKRLLQLAEEMQRLCRESQALFIINDYLDVALAVQADGLHIGQDDLPASAARRWLPIGALLGVSAATLEEARAAEAAGADYLGVGAIFPTTSKEKIEAVGPERIQHIRSLTKIPLAAIGGINYDNVADVMRAGADSACVISAVLGASDVVQAARALIQKIEEMNEKNH